MTDWQALVEERREHETTRSYRDDAERKLRASESRVRDLEGRVADLERELEEAQAEARREEERADELQDAVDELGDGLADMFAIRDRVLGPRKADGSFTLRST